MNTSAFVDRLKSSSVPIRVDGLDARAFWCERRQSVRLLYDDFIGNVTARHFFRDIAAGNVQIVSEKDQAASIMSAKSQEARA